MGEIFFLIILVICIKKIMEITTEFLRIITKPYNISKYNGIWQTLTWQETRNWILKINGKKCVKCGKNKWENSVYLQVHHIQPVYSGGTNNYNNLVILCLSCHEDIHNRRFPRNRETMSISPYYGLKNDKLYSNDIEKKQTLK